MGICLVVLSTFTAIGQSDTANNYVQGFMTIPEFKINTEPDRSFYTNSDLNKNKAFMIMFFSPDCDHCQQQTKEMLAYKQELKDLQILMVSVMPHQYNKDFYKAYNLSSMPNLRMGTDITHKLRLLYRITTFPAMFVYDVKGNLAKAFVGNITIPAIIDAVK